MITLSTEKLSQRLFGELGLSQSGQYFIAYSGGVDSTVLLHLMSALQQTNDFQLTALHVNHGLQDASDEWEAHCQKVCTSLGVALQTIRGNLRTPSEAEARNARYNWFSRLLPAKGVLLTAHHRQDRAETFLFNLMRGAGSSGLSSLRAKRAFFSASIVRPLLDCQHEDILNYARQHGLHWVEDPSNQNLDYSRNQIRHTVLPVLREFRGDAINNIARAAANLEQENGLLREVAITDLVDVAEYPLHPLDKSHALCLSDMTHLSSARKSNLIRFWLQSLNLHIPSQNLMTVLLRATLQPPVSTAVLQEEGTQFRFYRGFMYVMPVLAELQPFPTMTWNIEQPMDLYQKSVRVDATSKLREFCRKQRLNSANLIARPNVTNPKAPQGHSLNLKKWLQEMGVPPWRRQAIPLLTIPQRRAEIMLAPVDQQLHNDWVIAGAPH